MKEELGNFVEIIQRTLFSNHVSDLICSLGYKLNNSGYPIDLLISALYWVINHKLKDNIIDPFLEHCQKKNTEEIDIPKIDRISPHYKKP